MADHLSTMENVIVSANRIQLQSPTNGATLSGTSSGQTERTIDSNHSHSDAENIVSSTQETTNETQSEKIKIDRTISTVNKCDEINIKSITLPKSMAINEKHTASEESHIDKANTSSSQSRKAMDESKHHSHSTESSSKIKSKSTDNG